MLSGGKSYIAFVLFVVTIFFCCLAGKIPNAMAGGPLNISDIGTASAWDTTSTIKYHPEDGTCGPYSNTSMLSKLETLTGLWSDLPEVDLTFEAVTGVLGQVGVDNYLTYVSLSSDNESPLTDEINPIIFDDDASIVAELVGDANKFLILGFAGATFFSTDATEVTDGQAVVNCACIDGVAPCYIDSLNEYYQVSEEELDFTILHELGHFLNLDHSNVNDQYYENGDATDDAYIPVMFPVSFESSGQTISPRTDDIAALAAIYPSATFQSDWCAVTGNILDAQGVELMCADIWAYRDVDPADTISNVSGSYRIATDANADGDVVDSGECTQNCGRFSLHIEQNKGYILSVNVINSDFVGGSGVGPCINEQPTGIVEEELYTIPLTTCTGGVSIDLGNLQTSSTGGTGLSGSGDGGSSGSGTGSGTSDGSGYDSDLNPYGYKDCSLSPLASAGHHHFDMTFLFFIPILFIRLILGFRPKTQ